MRAMGLDDAAIAKPMIGVVSQKGETTPCNMTHGPQVEAAKEGFRTSRASGVVVPLAETASTATTAHAPIHFEAERFERPSNAVMVSAIS